MDGAGVIDQYGRGAERLGGAGDGAADIGLAAHVGGDRDRDGAGADPGGNGLRRLGGYVENRDLCALGGEALGDAFAEAAARAGDDRHFRCKAHDPVLPPLSGKVRPLGDRRPAPRPARPLDGRRHPPNGCACPRADAPSPNRKVLVTIRFTIKRADAM